jgi:RimJ/RimL family protein N-acetyltransferase
MYDPEMRVETERLILRQPRLVDLDAWAEFMADPETAVPVGGVQPRPTVWRGLATMVGAWAMNGFGMFSAFEKDSGQWVGRLGPWHPEGWPGTEVGWGILRRYWGRGYATEGAIAAIDWSFANLGWTEVVHTIAPDNAPSQAVARRLGSTPLRTAVLPAPFQGFAVEVWGQSRAQWQQQRARLPLMRRVATESA